MKRLMGQRWFLAIVFVILYKPAMLSQMPQYSSIDTLTNILKVLISAVIIAWMFLYYRKASLFFILLAGFEFWRIICTIYCGANYTSLFLTISNGLVLALVTEMALKVDADALLDSATAVLGTYVILNLLTILMFPKGMYEYSNYTENYLFGYRNNMLMITLPAMIFACVRSFKYYNRLTISSIVISAVCVSSVLLAFSATSVVGTAILCVIILMAVIGFMPKIFNMATYIIINMAYFFGVIILRVQNYFAFIIVDVLGRDLTFTGRTTIWDKALEAFVNSPVFGVGEIETKASRDLIGASHAHNYYLDLLYKNGVPGFILFMLVIVICGVALYKMRDEGKIPFLISGALLAFSIALQSEAYYNIYQFFPILALAAFVPYVQPQKDENGNQIFKERKSIKRNLHHGKSQIY